MVAAVAGALDRYTAHADQLGPPGGSTCVCLNGTPPGDAQRVGRLGVARSASIGGPREVACRLVAMASRHLPEELPEHVSDAVEGAALVTCWGRAAVPRSRYGRREILDVPTVEEPMRVVQQVTGIARGLYGAGLGDAAVTALTRRVALDFIPASRRAELASLSTGELLTTAGLLVPPQSTARLPASRWRSWRPSGASSRTALTTRPRNPSAP